MSYLGTALDQLKEIQDKIEKGYIYIDSQYEHMKNDIVSTIEDIEKSETNLCAECIYSNYINEFEGSECENEESDYYKDACPVWYGDEMCKVVIRRKNEPNKDIREVYIPAREEHNGMDGIHVKLEWICPICGGPRGEIMDNMRSYDGSRILYCNGWMNPCGHVDKYENVRNEAATNGLNER